jgi:hypothetical protein
MIVLTCMLAAIATTKSASGAVPLQSAVYTVEIEFSLVRCGRREIALRVRGQIAHNYGSQFNQPSYPVRSDEIGGRGIEKL